MSFRIPHADNPEEVRQAFQHIKNDNDLLYSGTVNQILIGQGSGVIASWDDQDAIDHGSISGLSDDDHTIYLLADGSRALTGNLSVNAGVTIDGRDISVDGSTLDSLAAIAGQVAVDSLATPDYLGATASAGALRTSTGITKTDGGNYITLTTNDSEIVHDNLNGFVANEHIDHSGVSITAGTGLTGGGDISSTRTISLSHLGIENLTDPDADVLLFWDDDAGACGWVTFSAALAISGTELDIVQSAIDHGSIGGLTDDDHAIYFLADGTRDITGEFHFTPTSGQDFFFRYTDLTPSTREALAIRASTSGKGFFVDLFAKDGDGSDDVGWNIWAKGLPASTGGREILRLKWSQADSEFLMDTAGVGTAWPLHITTKGNSYQIFLKTNGNVGIGTKTPSTALEVNGTATATSFSGANVTSGTDPGHDHTASSITLLGIESLSDPGADRILFWDDGETACKWLQVSIGLTISGTLLTTNDSEIIHDDLSGFVADEHIDWTAASNAFYTTSTGRFDGAVGIGEASLSTTQLYVKRQIYNEATLRASYFEARGGPTTGSAGCNVIGCTYEVVPIVNAGLTNSGDVDSIYCSILADSNIEAGATLSLFQGLEMHIGSNTGMAGTITTVRGIRIYPYYKAGTIDTFECIRIESPYTGGTATTKYAIYDNSGWDWYKNGNAVFTGSGRFNTLGLGVAASVYKLYAQYSPVDSHNYHCFYVSFNPSYTTDGAYSNYALFFSAAPSVANTKTNTGTFAAVRGTAYASTGLVGVQRRVAAFWAEYGADSNVSGTITYAYGFQIQRYAQAGTISYAYDISIGAPLTGGTVTNDWSIYDANTADSYFAGPIGLGIDTPDARLEIQTGATEGKQAVTIDQNDTDQPFIDFQGQEGANATDSISTYTSGNSIQGFIQIEKNGSKQWIPYYDDPTS